MWQLVLLPVAGILIAGIVVFLLFGRTISGWGRDLYESIIDVIDAIKESWRD